MSVIEREATLRRSSWPSAPHCTSPGLREAVPATAIDPGVEGALPSEVPNARPSPADLPSPLPWLDGGAAEDHVLAHRWPVEAVDHPGIGRHAGRIRGFGL